MIYTDVATIELTFQRAKSEGLGLSKTFLRRHCMDGSLRAVKSGAKYLLFWPNLMELLKNGENLTKQAPVYGKIRKVDG